MIICSYVANQKILWQADVSTQPSLFALTKDYVIVLMRSSSPPKSNSNPGLFDGDEKSATWSEWMLHIEPVLEFPLHHLSENQAVVIDQNSRVFFSRPWLLSAVMLLISRSTGVWRTGIARVGCRNCNVALDCKLLEERPQVLDRKEDHWIRYKKKPRFFSSLDIYISTGSGTGLTGIVAALVRYWFDHLTTCSISYSQLAWREYSSYRSKESFEASST